MVGSAQPNLHQPAGSLDCPMCTGQYLVPRLARQRTHYSRELLGTLCLNSPDYPVCIGLSGEPVAPAPTVVSEISAQSTGDTWPAPTVTKLHRTVRCAKGTLAATVDFAKE
jgi:hypothetical protein